MSTELRLLWLKSSLAEYSYDQSFFTALGVKEPFAPNLGKDKVGLDHHISDHDLVLQGSQHLESGNLIELDWKEVMSLDSIELIDSSFDIVILPIDCLHLPALISNFSGELYVDLKDDDPDSVLSRVSNFEPFLIEKICEIGSRLKFTYSNRESDFSASPLLSKRVMHVPLSMELSKQAMDTALEKRFDVLIISNEERLTVDGFAKRKTLELCVKGLSFCLIGKQSIPIIDVENFVSVSNANELRTLINQARVVVHTGELPSFERDNSLFTAMLSRTPVLMLSPKSSLNSGMLSKECIFNTPRKLRKGIDRLLKDDQLYLTRIVEVQNNTFHNKFLNVDEMQLPNEISRNRSLEKNFPVKKTAKIAVFSNGDSHSTDYLRAKRVARVLIEQLNETHEIILFVKRSSNTDIPEEDKKSFVTREYSWSSLSSDEAIVAMGFLGASLPESESNFFVPDDGINCSSDCDLWFFVSENIAGRLLQLKPTIFIVQGYKYNCSYMDSGESKLLASQPNLRAANSLILNHSSISEHVRDLAPRRDADVSYLSDVFSLDRTGLASCENYSMIPDKYFLIFVDGVETECLAKVLSTLAFVYQRGSYENKVVFVGLDLNAANNIVDEFCSTETKSYIGENGDYVSDIDEIIFCPNVSEGRRSRLICDSKGLIYLDKTANQSVNQLFCREHGVPIYFVPSNVNFGLSSETVNKVLDLSEAVIQENINRLLSDEKELELTATTKQVFKIAQTFSPEKEGEKMSDLYSGVISRWV